MYPTCDLWSKICFPSATKAIAKAIAASGFRINYIVKDFQIIQLFEERNLLLYSFKLCIVLHFLKLKGIFFFSKRSLGKLLRHLRKKKASLIVWYNPSKIQLQVRTRTFEEIQSYITSRKYFQTTLKSTYFCVFKAY